MIQSSSGIVRNPWTSTFVDRDDQGRVIGNGVNLSEINDLSYLIDSLVQQRIPIVHFSTLVKCINTNNSDIQLLMESNNGVTQFGYFQNRG
jgi:hypothetical protein